MTDARLATSSSSASAPEIADALAALAPELRARARRLCRDPVLAQDLAQEATLRALSFSHQFEPGSNVRAWALTILHSVFVTRCRRSKRERLALARLAHDPNAWTLPEPLAPRVALSRATERALASLPPAFRDVVTLVDLVGLAYRDAADALDVPVGTVMSRLHRGRRLLASALAEEREPGARAA